MNRWQDISISDASLKAEFITRFFNGDYIDAFTIISNNPQLNTKAFVADTINQIAIILLSLENNFQNGVIDYLSQQYSNFQNIIDNYNLKGNWSSSTTYQIYNFVTYNNIDYLYINLTPSSGNLPTNTDYWVEINIQGEKGAPGLGVNLQYNWSATTPYNALDVVYYNNALWVARVANINKIPSSTEEWETLSGSIVSFYNDGDIEISNLSVDIEPVQAGSGDPSPDNVRPISGRTGLNIGNAQQYNRMPPSSDESISANGITLVHIGNGKYRIFGTSTSGSYLPTMRTTAFTIPSGDGRKCDFNNSVASDSIQLQLMNGSNSVDMWVLNVVNRSTTEYSAMAGKRTDGFRISIQAGQTVDFTIQPVFMKNATIISRTYPETIYGGKDEVTGDGVTSNDELIIMDGVTNRITGKWGETQYGAALYATGIGLRSLFTYSISSVFKYTIVSYDRMPLWTFFGGSGSSGTVSFVFPAGYTVEDANNWLQAQAQAGNPVQILRKRSTPVSIPLEPATVPAIPGQTNVWADAGDVSVELDKKYWEEFIKFKLASIYTDYIEPSEDSLYNGLIWFEVFNPQNWNYLTNRNYTWNQINTNNDTWESVDRGDY